MNAEVINREKIRFNHLTYNFVKGEANRAIEPFEDIIPALEPLYSKFNLEPDYSKPLELLIPIEAAIKKGLPNGIELEAAAKLYDVSMNYKKAVNVLEKLKENFEKWPEYTQLVFFDKEAQAYQYEAESLEAYLKEISAEYATSPIEIAVLNYAKFILQSYKFILKRGREMIHQAGSLSPAYQLFVTNQSGYLEPGGPHVKLTARKIEQAGETEEFLELMKNIEI